MTWSNFFKSWTTIAINVRGIANFNPRLQVKNVDEYVELMSNLNLAKPQLIDINVSRNIKLGAN